MLKRVFIMSAIAALAFSGAAQTVMATKKYVDSVKTEVLSNLSSFAFFDGTMNDRRVSDVRGIGGFQFKDLNGDDEEFGMEFRPYNDYAWAFSIWDKTAYPDSGSGNPIFGLGWSGLRVPTGIGGENLYTIPWQDLVRASGISDSVVDDSHAWKDNPVNSIAVRYFVNKAVPRMIGDVFATGTVNSAYTLDTATKGKVIYEDMVLDAAWLGATSTVYTAVSTNYTAWTDPFVAEVDGCALHELSWIDGTWALWVVVVEPGHEGDVFMVGTQTGPENALSLNFSVWGYEYTFNRSIASIDAYPGNNAFGYVTDETVTNVVEGIVTNMLAGTIDASTVSNIVSETSKVKVDVYSTNSIYFIDDVVPTMKLLATYPTGAYGPNNMTAVEIGDELQILRTHYLQVDGNLAVNLPQNIRFMSTLDRNAPYDEGSSISLQDYLDAFNPVFVPDTIKLFQTNRSNYSVGNITAHESLNVADGNDNTVFSVTPGMANFMNTLMVDPDGDSHWYSVSGKFLTDANGVITNNFSGYASTDPLTKVNGNLYVDQSTAISSNLTVWGKILLSSWDNLKVAFEPYKNDINKGADAGYQQTLAQYVENIVEPIVQATNAYERGDVALDVHACEGNAVDMYVVVDGDTPHGRLHAVNKRVYRFDASLCGITNFVVAFSSPAGHYYGGNTKGESRFLDVRIICDLSGHSSSVRLDVGSWNFVGMEGSGSIGGGNGEWETIYSNVEPDVRTETVIRTDTHTWYDEVWDDELGEWVYDYNNPHTETYEWTDTYDVDMVWQIEPYTCKEFHFKQVGAKSMRVDVQTLYKTNPYRN